MKELYYEKKREMITELLEEYGDPANGGNADLLIKEINDMPELLYEEKIKKMLENAYKEKQTEKRVKIDNNLFFVRYIKETGDTEILQYAPNRLLNDYYFMLDIAEVDEEYHGFNFIGTELARNKNFLYEFILKYPKDIKEFFEEYTGYVNLYAPILSNPAFITKVASATKNYDILKYVNRDLVCDDYGVILDMISKDTNFQSPEELNEDVLKLDVMKGLALNRLFILGIVRQIDNAEDYYYLQEILTEFASKDVKADKDYVVDFEKALENEISKAVDKEALKHYMAKKLYEEIKEDGNREFPMKEELDIENISYEELPDEYQKAFWEIASIAIKNVFYPTIENREMSEEQIYFAGGEIYDEMCKKNSMWDINKIGFYTSNIHLPTSYEVLEYDQQVEFQEFIYDAIYFAEKYRDGLINDEIKKMKKKYGLNREKNEEESELHDVSEAEILDMTQEAVIKVLNEVAENIQERPQKEGETQGK